MGRRRTAADRTIGSGQLAHEATVAAALETDPRVTRGSIASERNSPPSRRRSSDRGSESASRPLAAEVSSYPQLRDARAQRQRRGGQGTTCPPVADDTRPRPGRSTSIRGTRARRNPRLGTMTTPIKLRRADLQRRPLHRPRGPTDLTRDPIRNRANPSEPPVTNEVTTTTVRDANRTGRTRASTASSNNPLPTHLRRKHNARRAVLLRLATATQIYGAVDISTSTPADACWPRGPQLTPRCPGLAFGRLCDSPAQAGTENKSTRAEPRPQTLASGRTR